MNAPNILFIQERIQNTPAQSLGRVAVLYGGCSAEREVSLKSGQMVLQALKAMGVDAHAFDPAVSPLPELQTRGFTRAMVTLHGRGGEDGTIQGALECLGIPYTGSGVTASAVAMDKILTKAIWLAEGLNTPKYLRLKPGFDAQHVVQTLGLPLIVKPAQEGSTLGLTKVTEVAALQAAFELAYRYDPMVLAEQFIAGAELTVPILGEGQTAQALPIIRIVAPSGNYDYHNKYIGHETKYHCPSGLAPQVEADIQALCVRAYRALGCSGWGRADVMQSVDGMSWLLEINTSPGMTDHSLVPMSAKAAGLSYSELVFYMASTASLKQSILKTPLHV